MHKALSWLTLTFMCTLSSCLKQSSPPASKIEIGVAPLTLPGVGDACYSIRITNDANQPVSNLTDICSSKFGVNGGLTYVATCDANDSDNNGSAVNTVSLKIEGLYANPGKISPITEFINPCAAP